MALSRFSATFVLFLIAFSFAEEPGLPNAGGERPNPLDPLRELIQATADNEDLAEAFNAGSTALHKRCSELECNDSETCMTEVHGFLRELGMYGSANLADEEVYSKMDRPDENDLSDEGLELYRCYIATMKEAGVLDMLAAEDEQPTVEDESCSADDETCGSDDDDEKDSSEEKKSPFFVLTRGKVRDGKLPELRNAKVGGRWSGKSRPGTLYGAEHAERGEGFAWIATFNAAEEMKTTMADKEFSAFFRNIAPIIDTHIEIYGEVDDEAMEKSIAGNPDAIYFRRLFGDVEFGPPTAVFNMGDESEHNPDGDLPIYPNFDDGGQGGLAIIRTVVKDEVDLMEFLEQAASALDSVDVLDRGCRIEVVLPYYNVTGGAETRRTRKVNPRSVRFILVFDDDADFPRCLESDSVAKFLAKSMPQLGGMATEVFGGNTKVAYDAVVSSEFFGSFYSVAYGRELSTSWTRAD